MSYQNRVTPLGSIVRSAERCTFTGNRGIIHDWETRSLLPKKRWSTKAWIYCLCEYKDRKRDVMGRNGRGRDAGGPGWTNLFFRDEATALSAGHRPCFYCQRARANEFKAAWEIANDQTWPGVAKVDRKLHAERLNGKAKRLHKFTFPLPDGAVLTKDVETAWVLQRNELRCWNKEQNLTNRPIDTIQPKDWWLVTPPTMTAIITAGFKPFIRTT